MDYINKVELQGFIGNVQISENVYRFSLCIESTYSSSLDSFIKTIWIPIVIFNSPFVITKGMCVKVLGRLNEDKYIDSYLNEHKTLVVIANNIEVITTN